jgi:hypothetical protein
LLTLKDILQAFGDTLCIYVISRLTFKNVLNAAKIQSPKPSTANPTTFRSFLLNSTPIRWMSSSFVAGVSVTLPDDYLRAVGWFAGAWCTA